MTINVKAVMPSLKMRSSSTARIANAGGAWTVHLKLRMVMPVLSAVSLRCLMMRNDKMTCELAPFCRQYDPNNQACATSGRHYYGYNQPAGCYAQLHRNLYPEQYAPRPEYEWNKKLIAGIIIAIILVAYVYLGYAYAYRNRQDFCAQNGFDSFQLSTLQSQKTLQCIKGATSISFIWIGDVWADRDNSTMLTLQPYGISLTDYLV